MWNKLYKRSVFETVRFPLGKTFEDIFIMHRLFDNANQVYVIFRVLGGFIAYVFFRCRGCSFIGYANSVHICFFLISLTVFRHFAYTDNEARSKNACEKRFRNGILQVLKLKLQEMREKTFLKAKILREG